MAVSWCEWWLSSRWFWLCCHMQKFFKVACALKEIMGPSCRRIETGDTETFEYIYPYRNT